MIIPHRHIFLIGNRGSGKTFVGSRLASVLKRDFLDLDKMLVERTGRQIADIVASEGWNKFRALESEFLKKAIEESRASRVFATGGGIILAKENCELMKGHGQVVWLNASLEQISSRLLMDPDAGNRPSLTGRDIMEELREIYFQRLPLYENACHIQVDGNKNCEDICQDIIRQTGEKN